MEKIPLTYVSQLLIKIEIPSYVHFGAPFFHVIESLGFVGHMSIKMVRMETKVDIKKDQ